MKGLLAENLRLALGGKTVLDGVSLALTAGEVVAVVGPNGAGKSTLLSCMAGLLRPDQGHVTLDGRDVAALPPRDRARRIGVLPQTPEIAWGVDVETLVGLGRLPHQAVLGGEGEADRAAVAQAMAETGVAAFARRIALTLSGGERARVLMARVLAGRPDWLLADEPLAGLDPGHQFDACDLLRRMAGEGRGVMITLHDLTLAARVADRVVVLCEGRIVGDGPAEAVLTAPLLASVYGVEAAIDQGPNGLRVELLGRRRG